MRVVVLFPLVGGRAGRGGFQYARHGMDKLCLRCDKQIPWADAHSKVGNNACAVPSLQEVGVHGTWNPQGKAHDPGSDSLEPAFRQEKSASQRSRRRHEPTDGIRGCRI